MLNFPGVIQLMVQSHPIPNHRLDVFENPVNNGISTTNLLNWWIPDFHGFPPSTVCCSRVIQLSSHSEGPYLQPPLQAGKMMRSCLVSLGFNMFQQKLIEKPWRKNRLEVGACWNSGTERWCEWFRGYFYGRMWRVCCLLKVDGSWAFQAFQ